MNSQHVGSAQAAAVDATKHDRKLSSPQASMAPLQSSVASCTQEPSHCSSQQNGSISQTVWQHFASLHVGRPWLL